MKIQLCCAPKNINLRIILVSGKNRTRLSELGFIKDKIICVKNATNNHETISVQIMDSVIGLRKVEAEKILVETLEDSNVHI